MAIEGPLRELGIHDVFQLLDLSRKTGELRITSELRHNEGKVFFDAGNVVYAEIKSNPHPLGVLLVRAGKIDEADLSRAREIQVRGDHRRLGQILVATGVLTERELARHVRGQIEEVVFELMNWSEGYFSFVEGPVHDVPADTPVQIPTSALLMEGARRIDEWSRIERKIPHLGVVPVLAPDTEGGDGTLDLLPPEWEVLAVIDGRRDLRAIAMFLARSEFETAKTVFGLEAAGVLQLRDGGASPAGPEGTVDIAEVTRAVDAALASGDIDQARARVEGALAVRTDAPALYVLLARARLAGGRAADAEDALRRALTLDPQHPEAQRLLGAALAQRGRFGEAVEWWNRWLGGTQAGRVVGADERERVSHAIKAAQELDMALRRATGG